MKKFLVIGNKNAITYKEIFPLLKENKIWLGMTMQSGGRFIVSDEKTTSVAAKCIDGVNTAFICGAHWFTNLDHTKRHEPIDLYKRYTPEEYPKYDNYDAIEVSKTCEIPMDYYDIMSVPITFFDKYCKDQFEIIGYACSGSNNQFDYFKPIINGKNIYKRLLIKRR